MKLRYFTFLLRTYYAIHYIYKMLIFASELTIYLSN